MSVFMASMADGVKAAPPGVMGLVVMDAAWRLLLYGVPDPAGPRDPSRLRLD